MRVAIVGCGYVGKGMNLIFPDAYLCDPPLGIGSLEEAAQYDVVFVCVPTPMKHDGSCDTSIVEQVIRNLGTGVVIVVKSTVPPGTCARLASPGYHLVFSPEYMGEGGYHVPPQFPHPKDPRGHGFVILGGDFRNCSAIADLMLPKLGPTTRFRFMTHSEAELVKYLENAYLALKVSFANEARRIAEATPDCNYHVVREGWLDDPRIGASHSAAFRTSRYFDGKCLPKDLSALVYYARAQGIEPHLLASVLSTNEAAIMESA